MRHTERAGINIVSPEFSPPSPHSPWRGALPAPSKRLVLANFAIHVISSIAPSLNFSTQEPRCTLLFRVFEPSFFRSFFRLFSLPWRWFSWLKDVAACFLEKEGLAWEFCKIVFFFFSLFRNFPANFGDFFSWISFEFWSLPRLVSRNSWQLWFPLDTRDILVRISTVMNFFHSFFFSLQYNLFSSLE